MPVPVLLFVKEAPGIVACTTTGLRRSKSPSTAPGANVGGMPLIWIQDSQLRLDTIGADKQLANCMIGYGRHFRMRATLPG